MFGGPAWRQQQWKLLGDVADHLKGRRPGPMTMLARSSVTGTSPLAQGIPGLDTRSQMLPDAGLRFRQPAQVDDVLTLAWLAASAKLPAASRSRSA